jgi:hypothetical protein
MNIVVNEELKAYIDPLTPDEYDALERSILAEGCRDALVLWGDLLVDGHNRYGICQKHGLPFQTVQSKLFQTMEDVHLWMIDQHLGRRSVSDYQRGVLALRKQVIVTERRARWLSTAGEAHEATATDGADQAPPWDDASPSGAPPAAQVPAPAPLKSREDVAKAARLRSSQVVLIEKIQKQAAPELVAAVRSGAVSISAAATVATLPVDEQVAAVAGGKDDIRQAAKRVREAKRKPREAAEPGDDAGTASPETLQAALQRIAELKAENEALRRQVHMLQKQLTDSSVAL